ncbi:MAG TPA: DUF559 domain-containing protein [Jatrophihabitantaceae bacterium]
MAWGRLARAQCGVITRAQLRADGLTNRRVDELIRVGAVEPLWRGVFVVRGAPMTYEARLWSGVLATGGVLGFATAAHLWGITDREPERVDVVVPRDRHLWRQPGIRAHRIPLRPNVLDRRHGLPITTRTETVLDYVGRLPLGEAGRVADRAKQRGWLSSADVDLRLRRHPGRTGNARLRELAPLLADGAEARSERVLHGLLRQAGIGGWQANYDVWSDGCLRGVVDLAFPQLRLAIEVDGWAFHHAQDRFQRDRTKQNTLVTLGWTVLRFTWADLVERPGYVVAVIRRHLGRAA